MAIYHCSVKTVSRAKGRSATAAAAYRSGCEITDERTGEVHDYGRKRGVLSATIIAPPGAPEWAHDRAALWNAAEASETRKNSTVAREFEIALPHELTPAQRQQLAHDFAREITQRHGCVADVAIHEPDKGRRHVTQDGDERVEREGGDRRNHHAHILCSTRRLSPDGFGEKTRELDDLKTGEVGYWRQRWAELANEHLERAGRPERIDHRSLAAQGIDREPTRHLGPAATGYERRTGEPSWLRQMHEQEAVQARLEAAAKAGQNLPHAEGFGASIIDLETQLRAAVAERDQRAGRAISGLDAIRERLGGRPQAAQVAVAADQIREHTPGAIEAAERLIDRAAAQARQEAERQAAEHRAKLDAEAAQKRAQEAAMLASLRTPSPTPASPAASVEDFIAARRREREQAAETRAPEPRGGDQWHEYERDGERYRHPEGRPQEVYWQNPSGEWHRQPDEPQQLDQDRDWEFDR